MTWNDFLWFAIPAMVCWIIAGIIVYKRAKPVIIDGLMFFGILLFATFIIGLWVGQQRPPLKTIGETRLWYSFFLAIIGFLTYRHWKFKWLLTFTVLIACVFVCINILKPGIHSTTLMPALQSIWFVPHVTVYILSYAMLGAATIASVIQLIKLYKGKTDSVLYKFIDNIVSIGFGFLMLGLLMGAVWAKEAWGHYWSWDPKETWAFVTCGAYLVYLHMRLRNYRKKFTLWMLPVAFIFLMITWIGVNYLPASQGSVHIY